MEINKLLIANRGEIACRIIRTAKRLGLKTVSVYSEADMNALHVRMSDESVYIGKSSAKESYLNTKTILEVASNSDSDAIHPGYGFLSESSSFAEACKNAGIIFVGPSPSAIALMADKSQAKRAMIEAGVPCVPGYHGDSQDARTLAKEAAKIGFPILIKAAAGGGGRGMRLVTKEEDLQDAIAAAKSEALNAFGADELILEKAIIRPRHIEIQIFGDSQGNIIYMGERDCSIQRRYQKIIEEAPCNIMTTKLRQEMGKVAVTAAAAVDYVGAGTVEFLLDEDLNFYFLEMNTRLQVEHPVTELVTGLDLVELQLKVATGQPLGFSQNEIKLDGHAIEIRLYAEDPETEFLPSTGHVEQWLEPKGVGIRVDKGVESGDSVPSYYDPMIAKVIAQGPDRETARQRLVNVMGESIVSGLKTNRDFLIDALHREDFIKGQATTAFIADQYGELGFQSIPESMDLCLGALAHFKIANLSAQRKSLGVNGELLNWSTSGVMESFFKYQINGSELDIMIRPLSEAKYLVRLNENPSVSLEVLSFNATTIRARSDGRHHALIFVADPDNGSFTMATPTKQFLIKNIGSLSNGEAATGDGIVRAPMHGQLIEILVSEGDVIEQGQKVAVLEAMKMQHEVAAQISGKVTNIAIQAGNQIAMDEKIMEIETDEI